MWRVALHRVRGLRPAEPLTPWVAWVCLPHLTPSFYGQGLRGLETRARPSPKLLPALAFPASSGSSLRATFHFPVGVPASLSGASTFWQQTGDVDVSARLQGVHHLVDGAQGQAWPLTHEPCGHTWLQPRCWEATVVPVSGTGPLLHSLLGNWVSVFLPKLE